MCNLHALLSKVTHESNASSYASSYACELRGELRIMRNFPMRNFHASLFAKLRMVQTQDSLPPTHALLKMQGFQRVLGKSNACPRAGFLAAAMRNLRAPRARQKLRMGEPQMFALSHA